MDIIFKGRHTAVQERFRQHATAKLDKIGRLDQKAIRIDVEVSQERNPRQSDRRERVELTIRSRGPAIRAEASADDRFVALDRALAKLESRLRRSCDRRKDRHGGTAGPAADELQAEVADGLPVDAGVGAPSAEEDELRENGAGQQAAGEPGDVVPIAMDGDGPLVVREKFHVAAPMSIDQALLEMELVGHDFFLFNDTRCGLPSVVYRRRGYDYGVLRLVEEATWARPGTGQPAVQRSRRVEENGATR